jgi:thiol-disulfide isomerase/thioredoxin
MGLKRLLFFFLVVILLQACTSGSGRRFTIIGDLEGMPVQNVVLQQVAVNDMIYIVDSGSSTPDGHFELSGYINEPGIYRLRFKNKKYILLSVDKGNIKITGKWNEIPEKYTVAGSKPTDNLKRYLASVREYLRDRNTMSMVLDSLQAKGNDSVLAIAKKDFQNMKLQFSQYLEHYLDTTPYLPNAVFAARMLDPVSENNFLAAFDQSLPRRFPNATMVKDFDVYYHSVSGRYQPVPGITVGTIAPNISLPDTMGQQISLYSLRGKYVLLDFWASWCGPCRGENPNVVAAYEKFKGKNFTIYSVSLDNDRHAWEKAIKDDRLSWGTQVSDLKQWNSAPVATFNIQSIPSNFLLDPTGKIIARDLRGTQLDETLSSLLQQQ